MSDELADWPNAAAFLRFIMASPPLDWNAIPACQRPFLEGYRILDSPATDNERAELLPLVEAKC